VDLLLDEQGLWTTADGPGRPQLRPVPVAGGLARQPLRPIAVDGGLGGRLSELLAAPGPGPGPTVRAAALARLVAAQFKAVDEAVVPYPDRGGWIWREACGPARTALLDDAAAACLAVAAVQADDPVQRLRSFRDEVTAVRAGQAPLEQGRPPGPVRGAARWADQVIARCAANARTAVVLHPPADGPEPGQDWQVAAVAIRLDEATTRFPVATADPAQFGAGPTIWARWLAAEAAALRQAWGPALPHVVAGLAAGRTVALDLADVLVLLDDVADRLAAAGFDLVAPGGLLRLAPVRRRLAAAGAGTGTLQVAGLGLSAQIVVDGHQLSDHEVAALAAAKSELVHVQGRWLRIGAADRDRLAALARRLRRPVTAADLLADEAFEGVELDAAQVLPAGLAPARPVTAPAAVRAVLRPYQQAGLAWLTWLGDNGVGGVLADDMGLGKTLQVLTWIAADDAGPTLVVCPMTLVDTWLRQAAQFTPGLQVVAFHGSDRGPVGDAAAGADVVVTTYGLLAREEGLATVAWHRVVLDEAQAIKNPDTRAARAARALSAAQRLAVTGTPVENHLGDLWSLFAFAFPGLLPRRKPFLQRYTGQDEAAMARLRAVVSPFLLRRTKTDPGIAPELPDRQVIRVDCELTKEQVGAYEAVVADLMGELEALRRAAAGAGAGADTGPAGLPRRAAVLAGIARLKQICVHPALLTESRRALRGRSGKVERLAELCAQILDEGQAVVIFTQFASFVPDLAEHLGAVLGVEVATLTGADSRAARAATVARFGESDGPPVLLASLKAGGTGLTLVRANHVIHLDRWWNPAVEDQASDRVWRIGQHQKVSVHVLVCPGTLEDKIDAALAAKRTVAGAVVRSTDTAVTELGDAELAALVGLVRERVLG
jgi:non-specific serine/threonine protein kinase